MAGASPFKSIPIQRYSDVIPSFPRRKEEGAVIQRRNAPRDSTLDSQGPSKSVGRVTFQGRSGQTVGKAEGIADGAGLRERDREHDPDAEEKRA